MNYVRNTLFLLSSLLVNLCLTAGPQPLIADYVIVGVGTSGAVLAKMLSDDMQTSVIAIHNGRNLTQDPEIKYSKNALITVASALFGDSAFYKTGQTIPQPYADDRKLLWVLAKPEGGASSINAGAYCRGTNQLYAQWEAIAGPLWSVDRILAVFKGLETYQGQTTNPIFRGYAGPLNVRQNPNPDGVSVKFTQALTSLPGVPFVLDYNDPTTPIGASSQVQYTQKGRNGRLRVSSATAFLNRTVMTPQGKGVNGRKLEVLFNSTALRTIWNGNTAVGVEYIRKGKCRKVLANKGVIVCAGLYSSPFLMHSGVGPKALLESLDIPVVFDNPNVGQGLADQTRVGIFYDTNPDDAPPKNTNGLFDQIAWLALPGGNPLIRELRLASVTAVPGSTLVLFDLCQPRSRGRIVIDSPDPLDSPVIDLGILSNPEDLAIYLAGFKFYIKGINAAFKLIDPTYQMTFPDPAVLDNDQLLADFIREEVASDEHFQSHCRMAPLAAGGVVDSTGHVYGVNNLIVADDSVSPQDMDGSPMASAYLIAANIALILQGL